MKLLLPKEGKTAPYQKGERMGAISAQICEAEQF